MNLRLFVPCDAVAVALDADRIAEALLRQAAARGVAVEIVRTGSRGLHWLEPMVEATGPDGRIAYGPVTLADAASVLDAVVDEVAHPLCLGDPQEIPFLKRQTRLTFARCGIIDPKSVEDYRAHGGYRGLARALAIGPAAIVAAVTESGLDRKRPRLNSSH